MVLYCFADVMSELSEGGTDMTMFNGMIESHCEGLLENVVWQTTFYRTPSSYDPSHHESPGR